MARLVVMVEGKTSREYALGDVTSVGRNSTQVIQLLDRLCSKEHALVLRVGTHFHIRDLGSRNGTFINGKPVTADHRLSEGDEITIGGTSLIFREADLPAGQSGAGRLTIDNEILKSAISASLSYSGEQDFRPAASIADPAELRRDYEKLRMAYKLQRDVALEHDLDRMVEVILSTLFENLDCDRGAVLLIDPTTEQLELRAVRSKHEGDSAEIRISESVIREVVKNRQGVVSSDLLGDSRFDHAQSVILQGIRSSMSVPLVNRDRVVGVIYLDSLVTTNAFTQRDLEIVEGLANQAALAIENSVLMKQREEDIRLREKFSRLLAPQVVDQIVKSRVELAKGGTSRTSSVLFSDLRGFTSMSERLGPEEIVTMLNEYFELMVEVIFEFEGTLDKYMGDGLMAVFGSPVTIEDAPLKAIAAALRMQEAVASYNMFRKADGKEPLHVGIGIDTGTIVAGYMGSSKTMNYTVIGGAVNLASRLCGVAAGGEVLISPATYEAVRERIDATAGEKLALKGISDLVTPYRVSALIGRPSWMK